MIKFNVGDKVKIIGNSNDHCFQIGDIAEMCEKSKGGYFRLNTGKNEKRANWVLECDIILDNDTMIEKLDEYCGERNCDDCVFRGEDDDFVNMTDEELLQAYNLAFGNDQSKVVNNSESTFTITTSDTITTLTDGTHTTSINRYYTDKPNQRIAIEEVVKKHYDEIEISDKETEIKEAIAKFVKDNNYDIEIEVKRKVVK